MPVSRIVVFESTNPSGERVEETFYTLPSEPKDKTIWESEMVLSKEGHEDIELIESYIDHHD